MSHRKPEHLAKTPVATAGLLATLRSLLALACLAILALAALLGSASSAADAGCPNEIRRQEQGEAALALPECRAYEMVTPPNKGSGEPESRTFEAEQEPLQGCPTCGYARSGLYGIEYTQAASDGSRISWRSDPIPTSTSPTRDYLSTRGPDGWSTQNVTPPTAPFNDVVCPGGTNGGVGVAGADAWSSDLSRVVIRIPAGPPAVGTDFKGDPIVGFYTEWECGWDEPRLVPGEPEHLKNLFLRDNLSGSYQLVNVTPEHEPWFSWPVPEVLFQPQPGPVYLAASDDLSHVVFEEELKLKPDAPVGFPANPGGDYTAGDSGGELYEWTGGQVRLVTYLPNGTPVPGRLAASTRGDSRGVWGEGGGEFANNIARYRRAVSADGSRIFWEDGTEVNREDFEHIEGDLYMREDGTRTLRIDVAQAGAPGPSGGGDFQWASAEGTRAFFTDANQLTSDSTAVAGKPDLYEWRSHSTGGCAEAEGCVTDLTVDTAEPANVLGVDGASEDGSYAYFVAEGVLTSQPNSRDESAAIGQPNLYLNHNGATTFIATLDRGTDRNAWKYDQPTTHVSQNGLYFAFNSTRSLTGYDNADAGNGKPDMEVYLYDAAANRLSCTSCIPSGTRPSFGAMIKAPTGQAGGESSYPQHYVLNSGQVFFETTDALTPRDKNGQRDVYEWEQPGTGSCTEASPAFSTRDEGCLYLLSGGTSQEGSHFLDATPDGGNVFITTSQRLVSSDVDTAYDYYDVRVDGGFPEPPPLPGCEGEACRGEGTHAPSESAAGTPGFEGPGNPRVVRCKKHFVKRHGRCVKPRKHKHKRHHVRHHHRKHGRAARHDRRAAK